MDALVHPATCFADRELRSGTVWDGPLPYGKPYPMSGKYAAVFRVDCAAAVHAVKCFLSPSGTREQRYRAVSDHLATLSAKSWRVGFAYQDDSVQVQRQWYPIVKMEYVAGATLNDFLGRRYGDGAAVSRVAENFKTMMDDLRATGVAHGDLQHDNIIVMANGTLRLVDYDGMYVPTLASLPSGEVGLANYQHPHRTPHNTCYGPDMDNFAAWVIYGSLVAIAGDPTLWSRISGAGDDKLLLSRYDYQDLGRSSALEIISRSQSHDARKVANVLRQVLAELPDNTPPLADLEGMQGSGGAPRPRRRGGTTTTVTSTSTVTRPRKAARPAPPRQTQHQPTPQPATPRAQPTTGTSSGHGPTVPLSSGTTPPSTVRVSGNQTVAWLVWTGALLLAGKGLLDLISGDASFAQAVITLGIGVGIVAAVYYARFDDRARDTARRLHGVTAGLAALGVLAAGLVAGCNAVQQALPDLGSIGPEQKPNSAGLPEAGQGHAPSFNGQYDRQLQPALSSYLTKRYGPLQHPGFSLTTIGGGRVVERRGADALYEADLSGAYVGANDADGAQASFRVKVRFRGTRIVSFRPTLGQLEAKIKQCTSDGGDTASCDFR